MAGVFSSLQTLVDTTLEQVKAPNITELLDAISEIFGSIMLLWVTFKCIDIAIGNKAFVIAESYQKILIVSIVTTIAFDASGWIKTILDIVDEVKKILIIKGGAIAQLDGLTDQYNKTISPIIDDTSIFVQPFILVLFWAGFFIMAGSCLFMLLTAQIILALALLFTPLAILSLSFQSTKKVFEGWLSSVVGSMVSMMLAGMMMSIMSSFVKTISDTETFKSLSASIASGACVLFAIFFYYIMSDVKRLAESITGFTCGSLMDASNTFNMANAQKAVQALKKLKDKVSKK